MTPSLHIALSAERILALPTLVLNKAYQPIRVTSVRNALSLLYAGRALALDSDYRSYDFLDWHTEMPPGRHFISTTRGPIAAPRVILLTQYAKMPKTRVRLSRRNLMLRDDYQCQYCLKKPQSSELNLDHVQPRSRGGLATWQNLVVACRSCNQRKGNRTPDEAHMTLARKPRRPDWNVMLTRLHTHQVKEWEPYLPQLRAVS